MLAKSTIALLLALTAGASAQTPPKAVKTVPVINSATPRQLYDIDVDGTVRIDWASVERLVATQGDRIALPTAQLMLAIRDGTWKPLRQ